MNINHEIDALKKYWGDSGPVGKIFLVVGFFLSTTAITTISSSIVQWKGFILDLIEFYQTIFVANIREYAATLFGLSYTTDEIHALVLVTVSLGVGVRMLAAGQKVAFDVINEKYGSDLEPTFWPYSVLGYAGPIAAWTYYGLSDPTIHWWVVIPVFAGYPLFLVAPKYLFGKDGYLEKGRYSYFLTYYLYVGAIFLLVGILAAINTGLKTDDNNQLETVNEHSQSPPNE